METDVKQWGAVAMGIIANKLRHIINFDIRTATRDAINSSKMEILNMNKEQLNSGESAINTPMPPYQINTLKRKQKKGKATPNGAFNLRDSGKLQNQMVLEAGLTSFRITSNDPNLVKKLTDQKYNVVQDNQAFGLDAPNREVLNQMILIPFYHKRLKGLI